MVIVPPLGILMIWMQLAPLKTLGKKKRLKNGKKKGDLKQLKKQPELNPRQAKAKVKQLRNGKKSVVEARVGVTGATVFAGACAAICAGVDVSAPARTRVVEPRTVNATRVMIAARSRCFGVIGRSSLFPG
jgi:hypothetical protein